MSLLLAQAAVNDANIHFDKLYSYRIPAELAGKVFPGSMVLVPFGRGSKARMAVVLAVGEVDESDAPKGLKTLYDAAPEDARLTPDLLELVRFLKERTFCTWFEAVKAVIPYGAQYRPAVVDGRHVMQGRLTRSTERLYTLAGELPGAALPLPEAARRLRARLGEDALPALAVRQGYAAVPAGLADAVRRSVDADDPVTLKQLALHGSHLPALGVPAGRETGRVLAFLLDSVLHDPSCNTPAALAALVRGRTAAEPAAKPAAEPEEAEEASEESEKGAVKKHRVP